MSSRYPDAIPVANLCSTTVVNALLQIFSRMGFPRELQTDQGTSFMSALTTEVLERFGVKVFRSSVYHPQSNPVERMHRTLKRILRVLCLEAIPDWEKILPQALFALRTVIHDSTGFSPAELVHGNKSKDSCDVIVRETDRRRASPSRPNKLSVQWVGPGQIVQQLSETNYVVKFPGKDKTHVYHVNMLKPYHQREENINLLCINPLKHDEEEDIPSLELENERLGWSKIISDVQLNSKLSQIKRRQLKELVYEYSNLFSNIPGCTDLAEHNIKLESERAIVAKPYRMSPRQI
ncbi:retrovirus-related Pol polyprotein from transposon 412 [Trichonephila clavipes]|nr:retrovirus-related Pol polyprotein from transposon 412 [Trichonephila clavipes]